MEVYRITLARWSTQLGASGRAARWNSAGKFVIYSAASRALACLENVVHRSGRGNNDAFRVLVIDIPAEIEILTINEVDLPHQWENPLNYYLTQPIGDEWIAQNKSAVMRVPSAIITTEFNYLINPQHPDFPRIKIRQVEPFVFDARLQIG